MAFSRPRREPAVLPVGNVKSPALLSWLIFKQRGHSRRPLGPAQTYFPAPLLNAFFWRGRARRSVEWGAAFA